MCIYLSLSLSLYIYIYIYIYSWLRRGRAPMPLLSGAPTRRVRPRARALSRLAHPAVNPQNLLLEDRLFFLKIVSTFRRSI